jgi:hypothetical protein
MTLEGVVEKGAIILEGGATIPDGTRVQVIVPDSAPKPPGLKTDSHPTLAGLLKYAGCLQDLPADFAQRHDYYIHGAPR